ncbi:hypothetical protein MTO96_025033 [Rhipicephalus appendiculatus]
MKDNHFSHIPLRFTAKGYGCIVAATAGIELTVTCGARFPRGGGIGHRGSRGGRSEKHFWHETTRNDFGVGRRRTIPMLAMTAGGAYTSRPSANHTQPLPHPRLNLQDRGSPA